MAHAPALSFDEESHTYKIDGKVVPSVTQIIRPLYDGAFDSIPPSVLERKRTLGQAVHLACELYDLGELDESSVDEQIAGYVDAWKRFVSEQPHRWNRVEERIASWRRKFAGTVDRIGEDRATGKSDLIDIKTTDMIDRAVGVQLCGYQMLAEESGLGINRRLAVQLRPDGTYRVHTFQDPDDAACFSALLAIHHWRSKA